MYHVLIENNRVLSIVNYKPSVPDTVTVYDISPEEYESLVLSKTHYFDPIEGKLVVMPKEYEQFKLERLAITDGKAYLAATDWKILRHLRERTLGITTTMSEEEIFNLELKRHEVAAKVSK